MFILSVMEVIPIWNPCWIFHLYFHNQAYSQFHDGDMPSKQSAIGDLRSIRRYVARIKLQNSKLYGTVKGRVIYHVHSV